MTTVTIDKDAQPAPQAPRPDRLSADGKTFTTSDSTGREIVVKNLGAMERMDLALLAGSEAATNQVFMGYATLAVAAKKLDGEDILFPKSQAALRALVQKLGDEGLGAISEAMVAAGWVKMPDSADSHEENVKN